MCVLEQEITGFLVNNETETAINHLRDHCKGPLVVYTVKLTNLMAEFNRLEDKNLGGTITTEKFDTSVAVINGRIIKIAAEMCDRHMDEDFIKPLINNPLVMQLSLPFIDRQEIRDALLNSLLSEQSKFIFIKGESKSGMSYLEKLLRDLINNEKLAKSYFLSSLHIPVVLDGVNIVLYERLAKSIINEFGDPNLDFEDSENQYFKNTQFINKFRDKLKKNGRTPIFFLHDFHQIETDNNLFEFLFHLIQKINLTFPKCIFIIAGLDCKSIRNWDDELRYYPYTKSFEIDKTVAENDIKTCFGSIYDEYEENIHDLYRKKMPEGVEYQKMSKQAYIKGMYNQMVSDTDGTVISKIGREVTRHINELKN